MTSSVVAANWASLILDGVNPTGKEIGRGAYGRVFEVDYEGTLCAAKEVHALLLQFAQGDDLQKIKDDFLSECQIWISLRHPFVVQFLGVYYPIKDQYKLPVMVMEKMQHSLRGLVEKYDNIPLNVKLSILDEVCLGLRYLHSRNPPIVHRDLTPNNILLGYRLEAKITDLGVAKVVKSDSKKTMTKLPGTPDFMPPEALSKRPAYGPSLDVFSYGGVILNVTTQLWPEPADRVQLNPDTNAWEVLSEVTRRQEYFDKMIGGAADLKPLVMSCLDENPNSRPQVKKISTEIKKVRDAYSQMSGHDGMSPIVWWSKVSNKQQLQMTSSLTAALEEMTINNKQLQGEIEDLQTDNTKLRTNNDTMKNEISQLITEVHMIKAENVKLKAENYNLRTHHVDTNRSLNVSSIPQRTKQQQVLNESSGTGDLFGGPVNFKWQNGQPTPVGRVDHTAVLLNGLVYVGGGKEIGVGASYTISCYNPIYNQWRYPINTPYCHFAMTTLDNHLIIAGGWDKSNKRTNQVLKIDDRRCFKNYAKMIAARVYATAVGHEGMLIITGGWNDKRLSSTELFDSNGQWYTCNDLPQPHSHLQSVIVNNILYLLGGYNKDGHDSSAIFTAPLDTLSRHQLKWSTHKDAPWCHIAPICLYGTDLVIVGGSKKHMCTSEVNKFNKFSHSWEAIGNIPYARSSSAAISTADNRVIVIGGKNDKGECTKTVWMSL